MTNTKHTAATIADELEIEYTTNPYWSGKEVVAAEIAHCYRVHSNTAAAAIRRLAKKGIMVAWERSVAGNVIWKIRAPEASPTPKADTHTNFLAALGC